VYSYAIEDGSYLLVQNGQVGGSFTSFGVVFDKQLGTILKHGEAKAVFEWYTLFVSKLKAEGDQKMADDLQFLSGTDWTEEQLDGIVNRVDYGKTLMTEI